MTADMCECGHSRGGHFYGKRTRRYMGCLRTVGHAGARVNTDKCECDVYRPRPRIEIKRPADPFAVFDAIHARECEPF